MSMSVFKSLFIAVIAVSLFTACNRAEKRAYKSQKKANDSQVEMNDRKMEIVDEYEKCIGKSDSDEARAKCESRLKGAQGL
jgi:hypothetical protein